MGFLSLFTCVLGQNFGRFWLPDWCSLAQDWRFWRHLNELTYKGLIVWDFNVLFNFHLFFGRRFALCLLVLLFKTFDSFAQLKISSFQYTVGKKLPQSIIFKAHLILSSFSFSWLSFFVSSLSSSGFTVATNCFTSTSSMLSNCSIFS